MEKAYKNENFPGICMYNLHKCDYIPKGKPTDSLKLTENIFATTIQRQLKRPTLLCKNDTTILSESSVQQWSLLRVDDKAPARGKQLHSALTTRIIGVRSK
uniref:Uncharacterized protein n=1 Tax=Steinernema glaseri TaxID=37863 RepID=A0A1I7ZW07_9BILA